MSGVVQVLIMMEISGNRNITVLMVMIVVMVKVMALVKVVEMMTLVQVSRSINSNGSVW